MCVICIKHRDLLKHTGEPVAERGGLMLSHFAEIEGEPATKGHLLIEPTRHIEDLSEMNEGEAEALGLLIREGARVVCEKLGAEHVYVYRINDKTAHLHFHLIPRYPDTPRDFWGARIMEYAGAPKIYLRDIQELSSQLKELVQGC